MIWLLNIIVLTFIIWWVYKTQTNAITPTYFWYGLFAKISAGILMGCLYKYYYAAGDTWSFYHSAKVLSHLVITDPASYFGAIFKGAIPEELISEVGYQGQPRALLMVRILGLILPITGGNYWLSSIYFSLFAFSGMWCLTRQVVRSYPGSEKAAVVAFLFLPTACFWGSGISKEAIFLGGFGYLTAWHWPYFRHVPSKSVFLWLFTVVLVITLVGLKYYYMAVLLPVMITTILHHQLKLSKGRINTLVSWLMMFVLFLMLATWLHPNLSIGHLSRVIYENSEQIRQLSRQSGSVFHLIEHPNSLVWMAINLPWAILTGLFRPNLGDWGSTFQNLAIVEYFVITLFTWARLRTLNKNQLERPGWLAVLAYVLLLSGLLALSTPNFGTLVRYKVAFLPVFTFLILYQNKWWNKLSNKS